MGFGLFMISNESTSAEETNSPLPKSCAGSLFSPCSSSIMDGQSVSNHLFFTPSMKDNDDTHDNNPRKYSTSQDFYFTIKCLNNSISHHHQHH